MHHLDRKMPECHGAQFQELPNAFDGDSERVVGRYWTTIKEFVCPLINGRALRRAAASMTRKLECKAPKTIALIHERTLFLFGAIRMKGVRSDNACIVSSNQLSLHIPHLCDMEVEVNRTELIGAIRTDAELARRNAELASDALFYEITAGVRGSDPVRISGLRTFKLREQRAVAAGNPKRVRPLQLGFRRELV
jgi:nucleoid DNA-binding protein